MWQLLLLATLFGACAVSSCPHHCQCYLDEGLRTANCSGSALTTRQQPSQIDVLNVRPHYRGFRTKLSTRGFKNFKNIKFLNLSNTSITMMPAEVFHGLNYIISIDLSYNKLKHLNGGVFKELTTLQTLLLRGNPLILTQAEVIVSKSLRKLDMGNCGLRSIPIGTFAHVNSLTALFLDGNFIQTIGYNIIPAGLWYLNLANNQIINIPTDMLQSMKSLTRIDLSGNPVKCTCHLLLLQDNFSGQGRTFENDIVCSAPRQFYGQKLSQINENHLCNLEFIKKERYMNSIKHFRDVRSYRKHNMIKPLNEESFEIQGDQPHISDELAPNHEYEVMFTNDDTRSMGTHMASNGFSMHYNNPKLDISDENNKLSASNKPTRLTTDPSSTEAEIISGEQDEPPEDLKMPEDADHVHTSKADKQIWDLGSAEEMNDEAAGSSSVMLNDMSSTEKAEQNEEEFTDEETKSSKTLPLEEPESSSTSSANNTEHSNVHDTNHESSSETKDLTDGSTDTTIIHDTEELSSNFHELDSMTDHSFSTLSDNENLTATSESKESSLDDVELLTDHDHNVTHETVARYSHLDIDSNHTSEFDETSISSVDDIFDSAASFSTASPEIEPYSWPTSKSDMSDYNYDVQHEDYTSVDPGSSLNANVSDDTSQVSQTTEVYSSQDKQTAEHNEASVSSTIEMDEGSGDGLNETDIASSREAVAWLEEQENETSTEDYSVEHVSQLFNISSESSAFSHYTSENTSFSEDSITVSSVLLSNTSGSEVDTEDTSTTEETSVDSSSQSAISEETASAVENETLTILPEIELGNATLFEQVTTYETEASSESSSSQYEVSESPSSSTTPENSISFELTSEDKVTSEEATTQAAETSTDSTASPILYIAAEEDVKQTEDSSTWAPEHSLDVSRSSSPIVPIKESSEIEDTSSSTPVSEVEIVSKTIIGDDKENMVLDPDSDEMSENQERASEGVDIAMISIISIVILLMIIVIIISLAVVCRKTKRQKNKIRLPADPESNLGTEMQDMLLPKPPENGVKMLPKNYTNGTTAVNGNKPEQKEEETPVLAEPEIIQEPDWEEKPEPIETVTARLTMLARPQTPVFMPKTLN